MENDSVEYIHLLSSFMVLQGIITAAGIIACEWGTPHSPQSSHQTLDHSTRPPLCCTEALHVEFRLQDSGMERAYWNIWNKKVNAYRHDPAYRHLLARQNARSFSSSHRKRPGKHLFCTYRVILQRQVAMKAMSGAGTQYTPRVSKEPYAP